MSVQEELQQKENTFRQKINNVLNVIIKHKFLFVLLLVLVLQALPNAGFLPWGGIWMRMQPQQVIRAQYLADQAIKTQIISDMEENIAKKYPQKTIQERKSIINKETLKRWNSLYPLYKNKHDQKTAEYINFLTYEQSNKIYSYIYNIDSFYFLRIAKNLIKTGMYGDKEENGVEYDTLVTAPLGTPITTKWLHPYVLTWLYRAFASINPKIPLMEAVGFFPIITVIISLVFVFWLTYSMQGIYSAFFATLFLGILGNGIAHTSWGDIDTDAYNILFPIIIITIFFFALKAEVLWKKIILISGTSFILTMYSMFWQGWWFLFDGILGALITKIAYEIYQSITTKNSEELKKIIKFSILFFVFTGVFVTIFVNFETFSSSFGSPFQYKQSITSVARFDIWPNVYKTVAELHTSSVSDIIQSTGGMLSISIGIFTFLIIITTKKQEPIAIICLLLLLWYFGMLYATKNAIRFAIFLIIPISIGFGIGIGRIIQYITKNEQEISIKYLSNVLKVLVIISAFAIIMFSQQVKGSLEVISKIEPIINDAWVTTLNAIKQDSKPNAIITSWWDYGHMFKYVAERPVTFDGGSQHTTISYWVARMFTTSNESEAIGILRMLDCGSTIAVEMTENLTNNSLTAINLIKKVIDKTKEETEKIYEQQGFNATNIIPYLKCNPPQAYVIVSGDMVSKSVAWGRFGIWNFSKTLAVQLAQGKSKYESIPKLQAYLNWTKETANEEYEIINSLNNVDDYIAPTPYYDYDGVECVNANSLVFCGNGLVFNMTSFEAGQIPKNNLQSVFYPINTGALAEKKVINQTNGKVSALIIPLKDSIESILVTPQLAPSIFTKLYFYR